MIEGEGNRIYPVSEAAYARACEVSAFLGAFDGDVLIDLPIRLQERLAGPASYRSFDVCP